MLLVHAKNKQSDKSCMCCSNAAVIVGSFKHYPSLETIFEVRLSPNLPYYSTQRVTAPTGQACLVQILPLIITEESSN